jgi:V/A-type H+-transporting ATPase subunit I
MAIVDLDKVTLYGTSAQKSAVVDGLQQLGCTHLIDLQYDTTELPEFISKDARQALRLLRASPIRRTKTSSRREYDRDSVVGRVLQIEERRQVFTAERDQLEKAIRDLQPWGSFSRLGSDEIGGAEFFFYVVPLHEMSQLPSAQVWHVAHRDNRFGYVVVIATEPPEVMPGQLVELDDRSLDLLRERLLGVREELEHLHWDLVSLTRWRSLLQFDLDMADDKAAQAAAAKRVLDDDSVFALQAWVPRSATADVQRFAQQHQLAMTAAPASRDEKPPTLLNNPRRVAGAEGCVTFYITPGYHAWDPTSVVFFSFSLFFAMIVSDAGYGLVMLALVILLWRKLSKTQASMNFRNLMLGIVSATILYGVLVGSYFGLEPHVGGVLDRLRVRINGEPMMSNQTAMMAIAVAIGVAHLTLANVIAAWNRRSTSRWIGHLGWAVAMIGAFLLGTGVIWEMDALSSFGKAFVISGAVALVLFSSDEPLATWSIKSHLQRMFDGLMQVANVPKAFGDTLSYLRLFALGLASAQLAVTFNGLAGNAFSAGGIGVLMGLLILTVGHGINFLLGLMGGVVHGLRLNCIEFFNWSLKEEGYPFQPFKRKAET